MNKEELINEIEEKSRLLYKMASITDLEKILEQIEKSIKKVKYVEKIINKIDGDN